MLAPHYVTRKAVDTLTSGCADPGTLRTLRAAQLGKHLLMIKFIAQEWPGPAGERADALGVLADAQRRDPHTVATLLGEPLVGAWAAWTTRRIRGVVRSDVPLATDGGYLGSIAAVAAHRTGLDTRLTGYVRGGLLMLPTLGAARLPAPDHQAVYIATGGDALHLSGAGARVAVPDDPYAPDDRWLPVRRLRAEAQGMRVTVTLDDLDPYRANHHLPPAGRLAQREVDRWRDRFTQAWELLGRHAPGYARELHEGLRSLVPLARLGPGPARSATARNTFGRFGLTEPESAADFAVTLVHEFQHAKLCALLDLVPLYDASGTETYFAPWRRDPRPVGGLLQGVYAFLGVANVWRLFRADPVLQETAEREFAEIREQVDAGLTALAGCGRLTADGERFVAGMRRTLDELLAVPVSDAVAAHARAALRRNRTDWQRRNARAL
jgi:HEXXH motif-containing protein